MSEQRSFERASESCFELLSAYLDNAVTVAERKQVEQWLAEDSEAQAAYSQLRQLQQAWLSQRSTVVTPDRSAEAIAAAVFADARVRRNRWRRWAVPTGLAATVAVALSSTFTPWSPLRIASNSEPPLAPYPEGEPLRLALDEPVVDLPHAASLKSATFRPVSR